MLRPAFSIKIGSEKLTQDSGDIISISVKRSMGLPIDSCELVFAKGQEVDPDLKTQVDVDLGYDDRLNTVFAGSVDRVEYGIKNQKVTALGPSAALLRKKISRVYSNQTAGKIVKDLAKEAEVKVGEASDGISFPTYSIDDKVNTYKHILKLAGKCNFDVYSNEQRQLIFRAWSDGKRHSLEYGKDIISATALDTSPRYASASVRGESPSSSKGSDTATWLTKQLIKATADWKIGNPLILDDPTIKDTRTAQSVAKAKIERVKYNIKVTADAVGRSEVKLGDVVEIKEVPRSSINGEMQVTAVEHYLSKTKGFQTTVTGRRKGEGLE